jgi:hypothetical protein
MTLHVSNHYEQQTQFLKSSVQALHEHVSYADVSTWNAVPSSVEIH